MCAAKLVLADDIRIRRACLDERNDLISIVYGFSFTNGIECNTSTISLYGSKDGGAFQRLGENGFTGRSFSIDAKSTKDWRFFIKLINVCDNDSVSSVDTLDADLVGPTGANIDSVSVLESAVIIGWTKSTSSDLRNYAVYYDNETGGLSSLLDSVGKEDSFFLEEVDSVDSDSRSITYTIAAFDSCNLSTGQLERHSTVHLNLDKVDYCNRSVELTRTRYVGWGDAVTYSLVYRVEGTSIWREWIDFNNGTSLELDLSDLKTRFEIKVRARDLATGYTSSSNSVLLDFREERSLDTFYIYSVNNLSDRVEIKWWCSSPELVQKFNLLSVSGGVSTDVRTIRDNISRDNALVLGTVVPGTQYYLEAYSKCNENLGISNIGTVIAVNVTNIEGLSNKTLNTEFHSKRTVVWNKYGTWNEGVLNYVVERKLNGGWEEVGTVTDTVLEDVEEIEIVLDSSVCYRITAYEKAALLDVQGSAHTNEFCFAPDFHEDLPNAFVANAAGDSYFEVPTEALDTSASFIKVFNRWGQMVYSDGIKWNGCLNNELAKPCPIGVYYFVMKTQLTSKQFYYSTGSIHLIR